MVHRLLGSLLGKSLGLPPFFKKLSKNYVAVWSWNLLLMRKEAVAPKGVSHEHANRTKAIPN